MPTHRITIMHGNPTTGKLKLDIPHLKTAKTNDKVKWKIKSGSGVDSIVDILDKPGHRNVWEVRPKGNNGWEGKIKHKDELPSPYEYQYSIRWKADSNIPPDHDPKISINPALHDSVEKSLIAWLISISMLVVVALMFWRKKR